MIRYRIFLYIFPELNLGKERPQIVPLGEICFAMNESQWGLAKRHNGGLTFWTGRNGGALLSEIALTSIIAFIYTIFSAGLACLFLWWTPSWYVPMWDDDPGEVMFF